ncbi:MAG: peptidoglycan-binding protein [Firmicutes bacterium]|nr:peptidoglycan-binding protein [Bacillota bacterium]
MRKSVLLCSLLLALCLTALCSCGRIDASMMQSDANYSVDISIPYSTATPLPDYLNVPDQVVIDANGGITVNDTSLLNSSYSGINAAANSDYETLSLGDASSAVKDLQMRLRDLGYYSGGISGVFDTETQKAVKRFEKTYGVMQTGMASAVFQTKLYDENAPVYGSEAYDSAVVSQYKTLQRGDVGSSVYALQHRLKELGYPIRDLTGVYDEDTVNAVKLFSAAYGLANQTIAFVALQKELYSENAIGYSDNATATSSGGTTVLVKGNVGAQVMKAQNRLIELGYMSGSATGIFDEETENAVRSFERACQRNATGRLTSDLQNLLFSDFAPAYGMIYAGNGITYIDLEFGDEGDNVTRLQNRLVELGYASGTGNGLYGNETTAAMRAFQHYNGLAETGNASSSDQSLLYSAAAISYQDVLNGVNVQHELNEQAISTYTGSALLAPLQYGISGDAVLKLQNRLNELGYNCSTTGIFDETTTTALQDLQAAIGIPATGIANVYLQNYVFSNAAPHKGIKLYGETQNFSTLMPGSTGNEVTKLQYQLFQLGFLKYNNVKDSIGTYHDKTQDAVTAAQKAMGYKDRDGVASPEFQCFLFSKYSSYIKR